MNIEDLNYAAGLFDGEGSCGIYNYQNSKNGKWYRRSTVTISNTDRRCLDYIKETYGDGWVGVNQKAKKNCKICFAFRLTNAKALGFLELLRPYVKIKGEQIDRVLLGKNSGAAQ